MQLIRVLTTIALLASVSDAADPIGAAKVMGDLTNDRLAKLLHVNQAEIKVDAVRPFTSASVRLDFYRNAKKVDTITAASATHVSPQTSAKVSLQMADLDFLKLADGKPDNIRFHVELSTSGDGPPLYTAQTHDVSKKVCSLTHVSSASWWRKGTIHDNALPLCWMLHDNAIGTSRVVSHNNPAGLVENNPTADIVIVSIVLTNDSDIDTAASSGR
jgi:hypothetical protein